MSGIIIPGQERALGQIRVPVVEPPAFLCRDLEINPQLSPLFYQSVGEAVTQSMNSPETSPRVLSGDVLRQRVQMCYDILEVMRRDLKMPLRRCFDTLGKTLCDSLKAGIAGGDLAEEGMRMGKTSWTRSENTEEPMVVTEGDIRGNQ